MREYQVRICERLWVKFPGPTRQVNWFRKHPTITGTVIGFVVVAAISCVFVGSSAFRPFDIAFHVARRHQTHGVTELRDFTRPMMSGSAGFHADQASRNLAKEVDDLLAPQLTGDDDLARTICTWNTFLPRSTPMVLTCMWTPPLVIRCSTMTLLAHSMPGAASSTTSLAPS
jgi:hypothetical protein